MRVLAIALCVDIPGINVYLFRKNFPSLFANHMQGPGSFPALLAPMMDTGQVKIVEADIKFSHGSRIFLRHVEHESSIYQYQGAECPVILFDELTTFSREVYTFLRSRCRLGSLKVPPEWEGRLPMIISASNPGNVGHLFVKSMFIDGVEPGVIRQMPPEEGGMRRQFIPSRLSDNPTLCENDPTYIQKLQGMGSPELVRAMMSGDWSCVQGAAFEKLSRDKHIVRKFDIPRHWTKFFSLDWGTAKPYAGGWFAVVEDDLVLRARDDWPERLISKGSLILYREMYGYGGQPDMGTREESFEVARRMHEMESEDENISYRIADTAMGSQHDGPSAKENFENELLRLENKLPYFENSRKGRQENYLEMRNRFAAEDGYPGFYTFSDIHHWWRTVPELQLDQRHPERGYDTSQEDHCADFTAYAFASRPLVMDKGSYDEDEYERARRKAKDAERGGIGRNTSRYS